MRRIGKYEILGLLGRGGMGAVYKVRHPVTGAVLALKLMSPNPFLLTFHSRRALERQFRAEAAVLGSLGHENLARVWDYASCGKGPYFLMEYCCLDLGRLIGETARVEEPTRPLPLPRAVAWARQALAGLARLHHAGVVHRDVKPSNLLLTSEGRIKIADLGLSRVRGEALPARPGLKVGSPYYAAPEQERDPDRAGPAADLYAAGATLHRLLLGLLPQEGAPRPSRLSPDMDRGWDAFFAWVLHPDPARRPASAREMDDRLAGLFADWQGRVERACRLEEPQPGPQAGPSRSGPPRREPRKVSGREARAAFGLDALWRPSPWPAPRLEARGDTVLDAATGLIWQRGGSEYPLDWDQAQGHALALAEAGFAGRTDWRLPTVEEALGVLAPPRQFAGHCLDAVFDPAVRLMWTADRRTFTQAWFADAEQGAVCYADRSCPLGARAVAGP